MQIIDITIEGVNVKYISPDGMTPSTEILEKIRKQLQKKGTARAK